MTLHSKTWLSPHSRWRFPQLAITASLQLDQWEPCSLLLSGAFILYLSREHISLGYLHGSVSLGLPDFRRLPPVRTTGARQTRLSTAPRLLLPAVSGTPFHGMCSPSGPQRYFPMVSPRSFWTQNHKVLFPLISVGSGWIKTISHFPTRVALN